MLQEDVDILLNLISCEPWVDYPIATGTVCFTTRIPTSSSIRHVAARPRKCGRNHTKHGLCLCGVIGYLSGMIFFDTVLIEIKGRALELRLKLVQEELGKIVIECGSKMSYLSLDESF